MTESSPLGNLFLWYGIPALLLFGIIFFLYWFNQRKSENDVPKAPSRTPLHSTSTKPAPTNVTQNKAPVQRRSIRTIPPFAFLEPENAARFGQRHTIDQFPFRIGRSRKSELTLKHHSVSRQHAELMKHPDGYIEIIDLESLNGVFVNNQKVEIVGLAEGDRIEIGDISLYFTLIEEEEDLDATSKVSITT